MMKLNIFGGFVLDDGSVAIDEKALHSNRLVRLLCYMLIHRNRSVTHQELIEAFWQDERSKNPEGALKNIIYRLRMALRAFEGQELILTRYGVYRWNPNVSVETDYEVLEQGAALARKEKDLEKKIKICQEIVDHYGGEITPVIASEGWMLSRLTRYKLLYIDTAKELAAIYEKHENWLELDRICRKILARDPLDEEVYCWLIGSMLGRNDCRAAMRCYEYAKKIFYDQLGIRNEVHLQNMYEKILEQTSNNKTDINGLVHAVSEKEKPAGVFFCDYPVFRELYRVEARRIQRMGISEYLLLITVKKAGEPGNPTPDEKIKAGMQMLEELLRDILRAGDVVSRYSGTQFAVLLPSCVYEAAQMVADRIEKSFQAAARRKLILQLEIQELMAPTTCPPTDVRGHCLYEEVEKWGTL